MYVNTVMLSGGDKVKVGICHNVWWLEPKHGGPLYLHVKCATLSSQTDSADLNVPCIFLVEYCNCHAS